MNQATALLVPPAPATACAGEAAFNAWRTELGTGAVLTSQAAQEEYGANTAGLHRRIAAVLRPCNVAQVQKLTRIAARYRVPLYPVSSGRNWGYGCALPVRDGCALVDLSGLRAIEVDAELGLATVEPGVTQGMLAAWLQERDLRFLVPVTGAGPTASLIGNALERGYGLTPYADHFAALTRLEAVLPDGSLYRSALAEAGCEDAARAFKWGLGPYLDGLFTQGGFGIVTRATFMLAPVPERMEAFFFHAARDGDLEEAVAAVREILQRTGCVCSGINLMNARRILGMVERRPSRSVPGRVLPAHTVAALARAWDVPAWLGMGALYGTRKMVAAAKAEIRHRLRGRRVHFFTQRTTSWLSRIAQKLPLLRHTRTAARLAALNEALACLSGQPSEVALRLAYARSGKPPAHGPLNPARDGCGLLWYSPLVPMRPEAVRRYHALVERVCLAHGVEPLVTLTSVSGVCFDSTVPILFDRANPEEIARAHACHDALLEAGRREGFHPYRLGVHAMERVMAQAGPSGQLAAALKRAADPHGIMAPGRYAR